MVTAYLQDSQSISNIALNFEKGFNLKIKNEDLLQFYIEIIIKK